MDSYKHYQQIRQNTKLARDWLANKDKIDSQTRTRYDLNKVACSAEYCGQSYAGASNYHKSPDAFNTAIAAVIRQEFARLSELAIARLEATEREALIACEADIAKLNDEIAAAKASSGTASA